MSLGRLGILAPSEEDIKRLLAAEVHIGTKNRTYAMSDYVHARKQEGGYILDLEKFWDKMVLAARVIVSVRDPSDVCVISAREHGKRAVIKFAQYTSTEQSAVKVLPDRFTPGTFTNQIQERVYMEPRLLILTDPQTDHQALKESSYVNLPVIALCNTDSNLQFVDIAIPCNNRSKSSLALVYWLLARTVRRMRGDLGPKEDWDVPVDLFYHRDPEEIKKLQTEEAENYEEDQGLLGDDGRVGQGLQDPQYVDPQLNQYGAEMGAHMGATTTAVGGETAGGPGVGAVEAQPDWAHGAHLDNTPWDEMDDFATNWQGQQNIAAQQNLAAQGGQGGQGVQGGQGAAAPQAAMGQAPMGNMAPQYGQQEMYDPNQQYTQQANPAYNNNAAQQLPDVTGHQQAFPEVDHEQW